MLFLLWGGTSTAFFKRTSFTNANVFPTITMILGNIEYFARSSFHFYSKYWWIVSVLTVLSLPHRYDSHTGLCRWSHGKLGTDYLPRDSPAIRPAGKVYAIAAISTILSFLALLTDFSPQDSAASNKQRVSVVVSHELAHQVRCCVRVTELVRGRVEGYHLLQCF